MKRTLYILVSLFLLALACTATAGEVPLAWDASPTAGVVGYRIHVGSAEGVYDNIIDVGNVLSYTATGLRTGNVYFFVATAYDDEGTVIGSFDSDDNESPYSNEVSGPAVKTDRLIAAPVLRIH